ncbi:MBL fold metallo-hydrolase [Agarilytica rhodophyticola]|uniref:MBL fold metallo-hydrolase n=1 Tax=Agarilytica rhodophyticola TaxID=1737490 RepID=UPI000B349FA3|nr:MBL fold metallo-hydrolase [Agarilytica rhodophyticola]
MSIKSTLLATLILLSQLASAHKDSSTLHYLGNEGVLVVSNENRILFDPFFHNNYGTYSLVPEYIRQKIFAGTPPFNNIDAVFISHAHGDHFSDTDMLSYLVSHKDIQLFAPQQAVDKILALPESSKLKDRISAITLNYGDKPENFDFKNITVEAVRVPHAGWPGRAEVENIVFRISLEDGTTVTHMGDADPNDQHFLPFQKFWQSNASDVALPPYWFFLSDEGNIILKQRINAKKSIGIHVPVKVPEELKKKGIDYFSSPGETKTFKNTHKH